MPNFPYRSAKTTFFDRITELQGFEVTEKHRSIFLFVFRCAKAVLYSFFKFYCAIVSQFFLM